MKNFRVNFIVLDTNMFGDKNTCNPDILYTDKMIKSQMNWVINCLRKVDAKWNVIIGHIPYKANGHKEKSPVEFNLYLDKLFNKINNLYEKEKCPKVQIYFCADEHNQQFLHDKSKNLSLVVAGSGGTSLDYDIQTSKEYETLTKYINPVFGFVNFNFTKKYTNITYYKSEIKNTEESFTVKINSIGKIINLI